MFSTITHQRHARGLRRISFFSAQKKPIQPNLLMRQHLALVGKRLADPSLELKRLRENLLINDRLSRLLPHFSHDGFNLYHQIAYARSLEIFDIFGESHIVCQHAQSGLLFLTLNMLLKVLINLHEQKHVSPFETVLRHPIQFDADYPKEWFLHNFTFQNRNIYNDHFYTKWLVSARADLACMSVAESALSFFNCNNSHLRQKDIQTNVLHDLVDKLFSDEEIRKKFLRDFKEIDFNVSSLGNENFTHNARGVLYSICIPKEDFHKHGYLSEPFGCAAPQDGTDAALEKMQASREPKVFSQVRLLTSTLNTERVKIFIAPTLLDEHYLMGLNSVESLAQEYRPYFRKSFTQANEFNFRRG